jgi:polyferredoxin
MDLLHPTPKDIKKLHVWLRALIQFIFFIWIPSAYTAAFNGVKYIFQQIGAGEAIGMTAFISVLLMLCIYTIIFGRFFCGFACAFGSLGDAVRGLYVWICKKIKKKPVTLNANTGHKLEKVKYILLACIVLACFGGVFSKTQGMSPWEVFSMLHAGNLRLGGHIAGVVILILIIIGMCVQERFFCRFLCPMGAVFAILPILPIFGLRRERESCIKGCTACTRKCPADIELESVGSYAVQGECFQCQKCTDVCPKGNIHCGLGEMKGNEILFTIFRAVLLFCLCMALGI